MKKFAFLSLVCASLFGDMTPSYLPQNAQSCVEDETPSTVSIRHREHEGVGYKTGYSTLDFFFTPNWSRHFQPFFNARGHVMNDGKFAANVGIGARGAPIEKLAIGGNLYFDYREVKSLPSYQIGSGLEILSPYVDFRINGYLPVGHKTKTGRGKFDRAQGNTLFLKQRGKAEMATVYAELGAPIPYMPDEFQLYVAAGPYYIGSRHVELVNRRKIKVGDKWGGKYRLAARIYDYFDAGVELTHDSLFHTNVQGYIGFTLPLGPSNLYRGFKKRPNADQCRSGRKFRQMMTQPIMRNEIIPIYSFNDRSIPATDAAGNILECIFVDGRAAPGGDGSFENPFQSLGEAEANSGPGDCIIVFNNRVEFSGYRNDPIVLQFGQALIGASSSFTADGVTIGPFDTERPLITTDEAPLIIPVTLAEETLVRGFDFNMTDVGNLPVTIIDANTVGTFTIDDNTFNNGGSHSIASGLSGPVASGTKIITNNTFTADSGAANEGVLGMVHLTNLQGGTKTIRDNNFQVLPSTGEFFRPAIYYQLAEGTAGDNILIIDGENNISGIGDSTNDAGLIYILPPENPNGTLNATITGVRSLAQQNRGIVIDGPAVESTYTVTSNAFLKMSDTAGTPIGIDFVSGQNSDIRSVFVGADNNFLGTGAPPTVVFVNNPSDLTCLTLTNTGATGGADFTNNEVAANFVLKSDPAGDANFDAANNWGAGTYNGGVGSFTFTDTATACPALP